MIDVGRLLAAFTRLSREAAGAGIRLEGVVVEVGSYRDLVREAEQRAALVSRRIGTGASARSLKIGGVSAYPAPDLVDQITVEWRG